MRMFSFPPDSLSKYSLRSNIYIFVIVLPLMMRMLLNLFFLILGTEVYLLFSEEAPLSMMWDCFIFEEFYSLFVLVVLVETALLVKGGNFPVWLVKLVKIFYLLLKFRLSLQVIVVEVCWVVKKSSPCTCDETKDFPWLFVSFLVRRSMLLLLFIATEFWSLKIIPLGSFWRGFSNW